jgi:hypothetical protein
MKSKTKLLKNSKKQIQMAVVAILPILITKKIQLMVMETVKEMVLVLIQIALQTK